MSVGAILTEEPIDRRSLDGRAMRRAFAQFGARHVDVISGTVVTRDLAYGPDAAHRLDVFSPSRESVTSHPVLLFVHGGGFVGGDKREPGLPFWDNIGHWAANNGLVGVTINYRLAPESRWPGGAEDVDAAVRWITEHADDFGADGRRIILVGQSAGATHVAGAIAQDVAGGLDRMASVRAVVLVSGIYEPASAEKNHLHGAYFGGDPSVWDRASTLPALATGTVPLWVCLSQYDPQDFEQQFVRLLDEHRQESGNLPRFVQFEGHDHLSAVLSVGLDDDPLGRTLREAINSVATRAEGEVV
jgi:triacylglycerol lipase